MNVIAFEPKKICVAVMLACVTLSPSIYAAPLNTSIPAIVDIPEQPLSSALKQYAKQAGKDIVFDNRLTDGKLAPAVKGNYDDATTLRKLLDQSGLEANVENNTIVVKRKQVIETEKETNLNLEEVQVRAKRFYDIGPMPGLALTKEQISGNIQTITAKEIKEARALSLSDLMNSKLQSVNVNDYQGNPFQMDVTYRGFTASPQIGTPQGLSVFFDGIRVNEPFGDVVNWDMIPLNALSGMDVFPGSNPLYGLNTLGGSLVMRTKSGFADEGFSAEVLGGSFGRKQLQVSAGINNAGNKEEGSWDVGDFAAFGSGNFFMEDGWRVNSPTEVNQAFGKLEWQGDRASVALSGLGVINTLKGNGTVPQELYAKDASSVFTAPDETKNTLFQLKLSSIFDVTDTVNIASHAYYRNSKRHSNTGDIIDRESFQPDGSYHHYATRLPGEGENLMCAYGDEDSDGIPDYYVMDSFSHLFLQVEAAESGVYDFAKYGAVKNGPLPGTLSDDLKTMLQSGVWDVFVNPVVGSAEQSFMDVNLGLNYYDPDFGAFGADVVAFAAPALNADTCKSGGAYSNWIQGMLPATPVKDRDGATSNGMAGTGVVEGTPTAVITDSNIQQVSKGGAVQVNWNADFHKFMIGASIDKSIASYVGKQRLGTLDSDRNVINDPNLLGEEYYFADHDATINDFAGKSNTRSLYFSETWTPTQTLNFNVSARYNYTNITNKLAPTIRDRTLTGLRYLNRYPYGVICPGTDLSNCPYDLDGPIDADTYAKLTEGSGFSLNGVDLLDKEATEKFSYHSINPAVGVTWQAKPSLNLYANWNQGTRNPSVIELGCAYDPTLTRRTDANGNPVGEPMPRSLVDGRGCKLPSALSGDPYLPQVVAQTFEVGARGQFNDFLEWNISAYRTNVRDDIYLTSVTNELSFFQSIGDTRRQGIEFGLAGTYGKSDFRINYSLTDATFQNSFKTFSSANSAAGKDRFSSNYNMIDVMPGNVMPGVPFNNLNINWGYQLTPKLKLNANVVAHSRSYLRGNENNAHTPNEARIIPNDRGDGTIAILGNKYSGTAPGYSILNLSGRYDFGNGWAAAVMVNNVLDKKYYTAGRLGTNPFAPSTNGAIGPSGFNFNSSEWINSEFISAGAPRGVWFSASYDFDAAKKPELPKITTVEPSMLISPYVEPPSEAEIALAKQVEDTLSVPLSERVRNGVEMAKYQVKAVVEAWNQAINSRDVNAYIQSYMGGYASPSISHQAWVDEQKLRMMTPSKSTVSVGNIVVAPMGKKLVAVFTQTISNDGKSSEIRKVLTFAQQNGQWKIDRERDASRSRLDLAYSKPLPKSMSMLGIQSKSNDTNASKEWFEQLDNVGVQ